MDEFRHVPVMRDEVVDLLAAGASDRERPLFLDATLGAGGHTAALFERCPNAQVVGLDRDAAALVAAEERLARYSDRLTTHHLRFDQLTDVVDPGSLSGVLFDLGVSSPQIDHPGRGFSFRQTGPLDMRMNVDDALSAAEIVNNWDEADLASVIWRHGDEKQARRIASAIVKSRPVLDTTSLSAIVADALPAAVRRKTRQPAAKTFQALRIEVNSELDVIEPALLAAIDSLDLGGRLVVLAYHSGEDRIVKRVMKEESRVITGRRDLPPPPDAKVRMRLVFNGAHKPLANELEANSRAGSARLRAAERIEGLN
ncbi:MAG: 16S rRNA (cytosine(1402)-N(4))-methyltransferase RsmH [Actinobacteria bacterium]|nr:16S rRNA (cytosine(1402)-N(4))-methyltransferase RsmH [Actinomycetota bacterium]